MPQFSLQTLSSKESSLKEKYQRHCGKIRMQESDQRAFSLFSFSESSMALNMVSFMSYHCDNEPAGLKNIRI